jgi:hypothetical protein
MAEYETEERKLLKEGIHYSRELSNFSYASLHKPRFIPAQDIIPQAIQVALSSTHIYAYTQLTIQRKKTENLLKVMGYIYSLI